MAVVFELVINFGANRAAARRASGIVATVKPIRVGDQVIELHPPEVLEVGRRIEYSLMPVGVSWGLPHDRGRERIALDAAGLSALGHRLYDLLRRMDGYQAAMVGWDPECLVDLDELRLEYPDELADASLHGLVLSADARRTLPAATGLVPFGPAHEWVPYQGDPARF